MKRREAEPMTKHTLNLFTGQYERLQSLYPRAGAAFVIRRLISKHIEEIEAKAAASVPEPVPTAVVEDLT